MPWVPQMREAVAQRIECFTAFDYRNPQRLPHGFATAPVAVSRATVQRAH
jgi:hypothetical protein